MYTVYQIQEILSTIFGRVNIIDPENPNICDQYYKSAKIKTPRSISVGCLILAEEVDSNHVPLRATAFRVQRVMTTSLLFHIYDLADLPVIHYYDILNP